MAEQKSGNVTNITSSTTAGVVRVDENLWSAKDGGYTFANAMNEQVLELHRIAGFLDRTADDSRAGFIAEASQRVNQARLLLGRVCEEMNDLHDQMQDALAEDQATAREDSGEPVDPPDEEIEDEAPTDLDTGRRGE